MLTLLYGLKLFLRINFTDESVEQIKVVSFLSTHTWACRESGHIGPNLMNRKLLHRVGCFGHSWTIWLARWPLLVLFDKTLQSMA